MDTAEEATLTYVPLTQLEILLQVASTVFRKQEEMQDYIKEETNRNSDQIPKTYPTDDESEFASSCQHGNTQIAAFYEIPTETCTPHELDSTYGSDESINNNNIPKITTTTEDDMITLGANGTKIKSEDVKNINFSKPEIAVRRLLALNFDRRTLATHTYSGKRSPAYKNLPPKNQLNPAIVQDIKEYCQAKNSECTEKFVRAVITSKCADESQRFKRINGNIKSENSPTTSKIVIGQSDNEEDSTEVTIIPEHDRFEIGSNGTVVSRKAFDKINWINKNIAAKNLMSLVFSRHTLATRTLSGKPAPAFTNLPAKKALNKRKAADIMEYCTKKQNISEKIVRQQFTSKCGDESGRAKKVRLSRESDN